MATYEEIYGKRVDVLDSDPSLTSANEGQVWYNSTSGTLKSVVSFASWVSGSNMTQGRSSINGNVGTQTASLIGGGDTPGGGTNLTEEYNGSGWSSGGNRATSFFRVANFGTQTAAVGFSGYNPGSIPTAPARYSISTEEYDGSSWTAGGSFPEGIQNAGATGTLTAGLQASGIFGPYTTAPSSGWETTCNEYDGSSWTNGTAMPMGRDLSTDIGTLTAALMTCGREGPPGTNIKSTFHYDGTNWTASTDAPTAGHGCMGFGTQTSAILCGGAAPSRSTQSILWDGTSWATSGSLGTAKVYGISAGTTTAGMTCSGAIPSATSGGTLTEEYSVSINTITAAAWASSGALGTARYQIGGGGTATAGLAYGGYSTSPPGQKNLAEEYNGATWTAVNTMSNTRGQCSGQNIGTQTAALAVGGYLTTSPNYGALCEEYDGTNWTTGGALTEDSGRSYIAGFGTQTAGVAGGGYAQPGAVSNSEEYDGSSWTAGNNMQATAYAASGTGTLTAGLAVGDYPAGTDVEEYDGTNWTTVTTLPSGLFGVYGGMGTQTDSIHAGGSNSTTRTTATLGYDGTSWSTRPALANALSSGASGGTSTSAFIAGGRGSPPGPTAGVTTCEEFTGETETVAAQTLTTS